MLSLTITLTRYKESNTLFHETLMGLSLQSGVIGKVLVLDQFYNRETQDYIASFQCENLQFEYIVIEPRSLSFARNHAISLCETDILLYIDSDALPEAYWAYEMGKTFSSGSDIAVVWGKILPKWHKKPLFLIRSDVVKDLYSLLDLGEETKPFSKVVGASFGIHIWLLGKEAYFNENLWRSAGTLLGWEETDLCKRAIANNLNIMYCWSAVVWHQILPERIKVKWITRRLYWGGYGKRITGWVPGATNKDPSIISTLLLPVVVLPYVFGYLVATIKNISKAPKQ